MSAKAIPIRYDRDKEDHFRAEFRCPRCNQLIASYTYCRAWTDNGLPQERRRDCPDCWREIDWSDVPLKEV
jgi:hypothetical protein